MNTTGASPARLLEMLSDRFGAFEAIAYSTIKLARHVPEDELAMDVLVAEAVLEFADDLREACKHGQRESPRLDEKVPARDLTA